MISLRPDDPAEPLAGKLVEESKRCETLQTGHLESPHLRRQSQSKVCAQGRVINPVFELSSRSKHTGQDGSSYFDEEGIPVRRSGSALEE